MVCIIVVSSALFAMENMLSNARSIIIIIIARRGLWRKYVDINVYFFLFSLWNSAFV